MSSQTVSKRAWESCFPSSPELLKKKNNKQTKAEQGVKKGVNTGALGPGVVAVVKRLPELGETYPDVKGEEAVHGAEAVV